MGISMGQFLILNIMAENDSNMIDLVLTHLTHPWGPPWTLGMGEMSYNQIDHI